MHVRIGLGAGESTVKDGDYFGMPSIEAARLCAQAPSNGILISGLAKTLASRCEGVDFTSAGELELKGFPEPVEAFSVSWAPIAEETSGASRWPLPALLRSVPPVSYVGRVEERAALAEAMNLARSGQRQVGRWNSSGPRTSGCVAHSPRRRSRWLVPRRTQERSSKSSRTSTRRSEHRIPSPGEAILSRSSLAAPPR